MNVKILSTLVAGALVVAADVSPQTSTQQKTLAATINVYVFPAEGQDASRQSKEEAECYSWAVENTGVDPFDLGKQAKAIQEQGQQTQEQIAQSGEGAGARAAVKGAAVGALVGEIASNDAGEGAAYGAAAGLIAARRARRRGRSQASAQAAQQTEQALAATAEQSENFKKAFSVCLEAKKYLVKY